MIDGATIQSHIDALGLSDFRVTKFAPETTSIREFFPRRQGQLQHRPDSPMLKTVDAAIPRLQALPAADSIFRWEAVSPLGRIVGYSTQNVFVAIYPWVMLNREWVASVCRY
jgi:hypothetical protein